MVPFTLPLKGCWLPDMQKRSILTATGGGIVILIAILNCILKEV